MKKEPQEFTTINQQIDLLKSRNLIFKSEKNANDFHLELSLINSTKFPSQTKNRLNIIWILMEMSLHGFYLKGYI